MANEAAPQAGVLARAVDPVDAKPVEAGETKRSDGPDEEGWYAAGSGYSSQGNADGESHIVSTERRYRLDGDRMTIELTYIGDDDVNVEHVAGSLELDGLELVDGSREWEVSVPAGKTRNVTTTVRASRPGQVRVKLISGKKDAGPWSTRTLGAVNDGGHLRRCQDDECSAPLAEESEEALSGETITVNVVNDCKVAKEFVLYAGYPDRKPPLDARVRTLESGEHRRMKIDAAQWFLHRYPDGRVGGGAQIDTEGAWVRFSGTGDECGTVSATDAGVPTPPGE